jgi:hypothetical protein
MGVDIAPGTPREGMLRENLAASGFVESTPTIQREPRTKTGTAGPSMP